MNEIREIRFTLNGDYGNLKRRKRRDSNEDAEYTLDDLFDEIDDLYAQTEDYQAEIEALNEEIDELNDRIREYEEKEEEL